MSSSIKGSPGPKPKSSITSFFSASPKPKPVINATLSLEDLLEDDSDVLGALTSPPKAPETPTKKRNAQTVIVKQSPSKRPVRPSPTTHSSLYCTLTSYYVLQKHKEDDTKQWALDLGQKDTSQCTECGMLYSTSSEADREAHRVFHRAKTARVKIPISSTMEVLYTDPAKPHQIVLLGPKDVAKEKIQNLLDVVDHDLQFGSNGDESIEREKVFVYLADGVGVGVIRVEKIQNAHRLIEPSAECDLPTPSDGNLDSSVSSTSTATSKAVGDDVLRYSKRTEPATLGVSRVWIRDEFKRQGIASLLLDTARANFSFGSVVPRAMCAMTQPTMEGRQFATRYFGTRSYLVYETASKRN